MSIFSTYARTTHDAIAKLMGERVTWTPAGGGDAQVVLCPVELPKDDHKFGDIGLAYDIPHARFHYRGSQFTNLLSSVRSGTHEVVTIDRVDAAGNVTEALGTFKVTEVHEDWDGENYFRARIEKMP